MEQPVINAKVRTLSGKSAAKRMRKSGVLPANMRNSKGEATMLEVNEAEFNKVWRNITKMTRVTLKVDGTDYDAYIQETNYNLLRDKVLHADFYVPAPDKKLVAKFKVNCEGTPAGVLKGGFLKKHLPEITLQAVSSAMPSSVKADISGLNIGDTLRVKDLKFAEGVTVVTDGEAALVSIKQPH